MRATVEKELGYRVVDEVFDPVDVRLTLRERKADFLFQTWRDGRIPANCADLFELYPSLIIVGFSDDGNRVHLCQRNFATESLSQADLSTVLAAIRRTDLDRVLGISEGHLMRGIQG